MNTTDSSVFRPGWVARLAITAVIGLAGGALAYPILVRKPVGITVTTMPDTARGVTCYLTNTGGISCVPDQWFLPPAAELKPQATPAPSRGWDL